MADNWVVSPILPSIAAGIGIDPVRAGLLITAYMMTGVFAASIMPISLALIGDLFSMEERQSAIGTFMGVSFLG